MNLITDVQLAEGFGIPVEKLHELRIRHGWPCVKLGRFEWRFTPEQVERIVAQHTHTPGPRHASTDTPSAARPAVSGQTARSARRTRAG